MPKDRPDEIDLKDADAVAYWTRRFAITREQLAEIVARVGTDAQSVAAEIAASASTLEPGPPGDQRSTSRTTKS